MKIFDKIKFGAILILTVVTLCVLGFIIKDMQDRRSEAASIVVSLHIPYVDPNYPCDALNPERGRIHYDTGCNVYIDSANALQEIDGILLRNGFTPSGAKTYTRGEGAGSVEAFITAYSDWGILTVNVKTS